jgi:hypothetical protein
MAHLEDFLAEYYDWRGYVVKRNVRVGRRALGGWDMELDVVAYDPHTKHLIHLEPSLDAHSWEKREQRFAKKFSAGEKFIFSEVFTWLDTGTPIDQVAVLPRHPKGRDTLAGARLQSVDELVSEICADVRAKGIGAKSAVPEQYPLLRTVQLVTSGYYGSVCV